MCSTSKYDGVTGAELEIHRAIGPGKPNRISGGASLSGSGVGLRDAADARQGGEALDHLLLERAPRLRLV